MLTSSNGELAHAAPGDAAIEIAIVRIVRIGDQQDVVGPAVVHRITFQLVAGAVRENVGIMDVTAFTKVLVEGPDAYAFLDRLTANRMPQKVGSITLTHMLNRAGRIELETTIVRMADDDEMVPSACQRYVEPLCVVCKANRGASRARDEDNVPLPALKCVHGAHKYGTITHATLLINLLAE